MSSPVSRPQSSDPCCLVYVLIPLRRLMISQDRHDIWVTMASHTDGWIEHLKDQQAPAGFLTMQEYGPWKIENHEHVRHFAQIRVKFFLQVTERIKEAKSSDSN